MNQNTRRPLYRSAPLRSDLSDWSATEGLKSLETRMLVLVETKEGLWKAKDELYTLMVQDLDPLLAHITDAACQCQVRSELREILTCREDIIGIFPLRRGLG